MKCQECITGSSMEGCRQLLCFSEVQRKRLARVAGLGEGAGGQGTLNPTCMVPRTMANYVGPCWPPPPPPPSPHTLQELEKTKRVSESKVQKRKRVSAVQGQSSELTKPRVALGFSQRVKGLGIYICPRRLKESWTGWGEGSGWAGKEKENKLCWPLNIHDSSFAKANGKHINCFTTLLNAKKMDGGHSMLWGKLGGI